MKKELKLYELEEALKHIKPSPGNKYAPLSLQKDDKRE